MNRVLDVPLLEDPKIVKPVLVSPVPGTVAGARRAFEVWRQRAADSSSEVTTASQMLRTRSKERGLLEDPKKDKPVLVSPGSATLGTTAVLGRGKSIGEKGGMFERDSKDKSQMTTVDSSGARGNSVKPECSPVLLRAASKFKELCENNRSRDKRNSGGKITSSDNEIVDQFLRGLFGEIECVPDSCMDRLISDYIRNPNKDNKAKIRDRLLEVWIETHAFKDDMERKDEDKCKDKDNLSLSLEEKKEVDKQMLLALIKLIWDKKEQLEIGGKSLTYHINNDMPLRNSIVRKRDENRITRVLFNLLLETFDIDAGRVLSR